MKFLDFFSGIGGFRLGMEMAGHECIGHCEINKYANLSYMAMHNPKEGEWYADDIRNVKPEELPEADIYCGGFPCQAFSIAGLRGGSKIQEELYSLKLCDWQMYESLSIYSLKMSKDCFRTIAEELSQRSCVQWKTVGIMRNGRCATLNIQEYHRIEKECSLLDFLEETVDQKYYLSEEQQARLLSYKNNSLIPLQQEQSEQNQPDRMLLRVNSFHKNQS